MVPCVNRRTNAYLTWLNRGSLKLLCQLITGYCALNRHLWIMQKTESLECKFCETGDPEPVQHFVCWVDLLFKCFGVHYVLPEDFDHPLSQVCWNSSIALNGFLTGGRVIRHSKSNLYMGSPPWPERQAATRSPFAFAMAYP